MKLQKASLMSSGHRGRPRERGVALITALLLLLLLTGMVVAMVTAVNSDMLINNYYGNFRGSFYAADSGLAIVRQALANQLESAIPPSFPPTQAPIAIGAEGAALTSVIATYGSSYSPLGNAQAAPLPWPASFEMDKTAADSYLTFVSCPSNLPGVTCANPCPTGCTTAATTPSSYTYNYNYHFLVYGKALGTQNTTLEETGTLTINVPLTPSPNTPASFAAWGMFIDQSPLCSGSYLVAGTINGPVFTNGAWNFGSSSSYGQYHFTGTVGSHLSQAGFEESGNCVPSTATSVAGVSTTYTTTPTWGEPAVALPANDYNQQNAVLDGIGNPTSTTTKQASLMNSAEVAYPASTPSTGVYLPYTTTTTPPSFTGGGILVEGDATVELNPNKTDTTGTQTYQITQGTTVTTIVVNNTSNTTSFSDNKGHSVPSIKGVPSVRNSSGAALSPATMLYVDGNITGLSGPGEGSTSSAGINTNPSVQNGTALTITAAKDITITGDILYASEPVTTVSSQGTMDVPITANQLGQSLGIFTATGNVNLKNSQSDTNNLQIDAAIATISAGGSGGIQNTGNAINTLTIVGGRIQSTLMNINATTRNVDFVNGLAPPWFPSTTIPANGTDSAGVPTPTFQRVQWVNKTTSLP